MNLENENILENIIKTFYNKKLKQIVNIYQLKYTNGIAQGLGDYIRGCFCLLQISLLLNLQFDMELTNHPISKYIKREDSWIKYNMDYSIRLQLIHFLFGIAGADGQFHPAEINVIERIASFMGIYESDLNSIKAMFVKETDSAYKILEITPDATDDEVKKAYRQMAIKYHPDKVSTLGEDVQKAANEKFQQLNNAYEQIKKQRGMN